jgi:hypothetical protein
MSGENTPRRTPAELMFARCAGLITVRAHTPSGSRSNCWLNRCRSLEELSQLSRLRRLPV